VIKLPIASPYGFLESVYWVQKNLLGFSHAHAGLVQSIPYSHVLNENTVPQYRLVFVGDIMPAWKKSFGIGDKLKEFIRDGDYLIGNLEGIVINSSKTPLSWLPSDLWHNPIILDDLSTIFPPARTCLSVANNHAGDLGEAAFFTSIEMLSAKHFNACGSTKHPFCDLNDDIRIISATMWSNRKNDFVFRLPDARRYCKPNAFNILFPHFGYEFELYPRPEMIALAKALLKDFDAVVGHHPHCPQPIAAEPGPHGRQLLAYSLGGFTIITNKLRCRYGIVAKVSVGRNDQGAWRLGKVEWRYTQCVPLPNKNLMVDISESPSFVQVRSSSESSGAGLS
jgi:hypothetical protein